MHTSNECNRRRALLQDRNCRTRNVQEGRGHSCDKRQQACHSNGTQMRGKNRREKGRQGVQGQRVQRERDKERKISQKRIFMHQTSSDIGTS